VGKPYGPKRRPSTVFGNEFAIFSAIIVMMLLVIVVVEPVDMKPPDWWVKAAHKSNGTSPQNGGNTTPQRKEVEVLSKTGHTSEGSTTTIELEMKDPKAVELTVTLEWTDDIGSNDEFGLKISNETGDLESDQGTTGTLTVKVSAQGGNGGLAGNFTISITAINCPGLVGPLPVDRDTGNDWSIAAKMVVEGGP
jgi:hypothetical protein